MTQEEYDYLSKELEAQGIKLEGLSPVQIESDITSEVAGRKKAIKTGYDIAAKRQAQAESLQRMQGDQMRAFDVATEQGTQGIQRQAATALAAGQAQSGGLGGGGGYGALLQTGQQSGQDVAQFQAQQGAGRSQLAWQQQQAIDEAQLAALGQLSEAQKLEASIGSEREIYDKKLATAMAQADEKVALYKDDLIGDQESAADAVDQLAEQESDPKIKAALKARANKLRSGEEDI